MRKRNMGIVAPLVALLALSLAHAETTDPFTLSSEDFFALDAVGAPLEPGKIDDRLLNAAVFHETNRIRIEHRLQPLRYRDPLGRAAAIQADSMLEHKYVEHENPHDEGMRWPMDRVLSTGYKPRNVSENVAKVFRVQYQPPRPYYKLQRGGKTVFSYESDGQPIPAHTYRTFAQFLLNEWMGSPGHRENILRKDSEEFGAAIRFDYRKDDLDEAYAVQVFAKPLK